LSKPLIRVVAAALFDAEGRVLIAERPSGKHMAGRWEFPGGKVAEGESEAAALARELYEEIGVEVMDASPFMRLQHQYPDRCVELSLWLVRESSGEARPLDGQQLKWVERSRLEHEDILEADRPFIEALMRLGTDAVG
jgi:8-oxo-dGTP diphosphatase